MKTSSAALLRNVLFFAQGGLFAVLMSRILGLYIPNAVFLSLGAALGLCGLIYLILVARSGEAGARKWFFIVTGASAAGIVLGAILHNVLAALGSYILGVVFFGLALLVFPVLFVGGWCGSLVLVGTAGEPVSRQRKRAAGAAAALAVGALAVALGMRVDGEGYSVSSEVVRAPEQAIERMLVVAEVHETLVPVFAHSFQHSLVSALEANGIEALIGPSSLSGDPMRADAVLRITVKPLYRTHRDGYEALVGTAFEATLADTATGDDAWRLSGTVDYIGDQFFKEHGFRVHEGILKEFAWHTTAPSSGPSWSTSRVASPCGSIPTPRPGNATDSGLTRTHLKTTVSA